VWRRKNWTGVRYGTEERSVPYETWTASDRDGETLARALEAHLNEFAERIISVSYAVNDQHHVLAVYEPVDPKLTGEEGAAVTVAEHIIEGTHL
jgi:hypothetical protein